MNCQVCGVETELDESRLDEDGQLVCLRCHGGAAPPIHEADEADDEEADDEEADDEEADEVDEADEPSEPEEPEARPLPDPPPPPAPRQGPTLDGTPFEQAEPPGSGRGAWGIISFVLAVLVLILRVGRCASADHGPPPITLPNFPRPTPIPTFATDEETPGVDCDTVEDGRECHAPRITREVAERLGREHARTPYLELIFDGQPDQADFAGVAAVPWLERLSLPDARAIDDLGPLAKLTSLRALSLGLSGVASLATLSRFVNLEYLSLTACRDVADKDLTALAPLRSLEVLQLNDMPIHDLTGVESLGALQSLQLVGLDKTDLRPLAGLKSIRELYVERVQGDLSVIGKLTTLHSLYLRDTTAVPLQAVARLPELQSLEIADPSLTDLGPLARLALTYLDIADTSVKKLGPLAAMKTLERVVVAEGVLADEIDKLSAARPELAIVQR